MKHTGNGPGMVQESPWYVSHSFGLTVEAFLFSKGIIQHCSCQRLYRLAAPMCPALLLKWAWAFLCRCWYLSQRTSRWQWQPAPCAAGCRRTASSSADTTTDEATDSSSSGWGLLHHGSRRGRLTSHDSADSVPSYQSPSTGPHVAYMSRDSSLLSSLSSVRETSSLTVDSFKACPHSCTASLQHPLLLSVGSLFY